MAALQSLELLLEVSTPQGPELHLDVFTLQRSTLPGSELHLDVSAYQWHVLLLEVSTTQGPELHLDVFPLQRYEPLLEVSTLLGI